MSQAGLNNVASIPSVATTFVEDSGTATPAANILKIIGGNGVTTSGAGNTVTIKNLRDVARYVVAPVAGQAGYTSIQTAINQAVTDGASAATPALVWLWAGTYTENVTLKPFVFLAAASENAHIVGNTVFTPINPGDLMSLHQIEFITPGGGGAAFTIAGANTCTVEIDSCHFHGTTGTAIVVNNANATVSKYNCVTTAAAGFKRLDVVDCTFVKAFNSENTSTDTPSTIAGTGQVVYFNGLITDSFILTGTALLALNSPACISLGALELLNISATNAVVVLHTFVQSAAASGFWATGTGILTYDSVTASLGTAVKVDPALNILEQTLEIGNLSFDGGFTNISADGQLIIGKTGGQPTISTLTPGAGIAIANGAGSITISATGAGFAWNVVLGAAQGLVKENGYINTNVGLTTFTLPVTAAVGDTFRIAGYSAGGWKIAQNAGQSIHVVNATSMVGAPGSVASNESFDCVELICVVADTEFTIIDFTGNLTVV